MTKIKGNLFNKSISEKVMLGVERLNALTENSNLPVAADKLAAYGDAVEKLKNALDEVATAIVTLNTKYANQTEAENEYDRQTSIIVNEINGLTDDETKLSSSGFPKSKLGAGDKAASLTRPENLLAMMTKKEGEVRVRWNSVKGVHGYFLQYSPDASFPKDNTTNLPVGKITRMTISELKIGTKIWFRVAAIKGNETGPWSDPAMSPVR